MILALLKEENAKSEAPLRAPQRLKNEKIRRESGERDHLGTPKLIQG